MNDPTSNPAGLSTADGLHSPLGDDEAVYLYGVAAAEDLTLSMQGLDDATPVQTVRCGSWTAVVDTVARAAWTGEQGESNLQTLTWVGPRAVRHEEVVEAIMAAAPVFPARFGTLFSSVDHLRTRLDAQAEALADYFQRVKGREEWAVKGILDRDVAQESLADPAEDADDTPGTAYLKHRQRVQDARQDVEAWLDDVSDRLQDRLRETAVDIVALDPGARPNEDGEMVLNWAVLVDTAATDALHDAVRAAGERYAEYGLRFDLTGPWPPYTFRPVDDDWSPSDL